MHEYYRENSAKLKKANIRLVKPIAKELEQVTGKSFSELWEEIWQVYVMDLMEKFPYLGGEGKGGTGNLTGAYTFVAMGEVLKEYNISMYEIGHLMTIAYERMMKMTPVFMKMIMRKAFSSPKLLTRMMKKTDEKNAANAEKYPGSFVTETLDDPGEYSFSFYYKTCPLADFAKKNGYGEYMPYLCNLDYIMFGVFGVPFRRTHTIFADGDYCDFNLKLGADVLDWWEPVGEQGEEYK